MSNAPHTLAASRLTRGVVASLVAVYLVWGSTYLALRHVVEALPPLGAAGVRYLVAGSILYAAARRRGAPAVTTRQWLASFPTGALLFLVGNGFVSIAEQTVASGLAAVACAAMPLFACAIAVPFGERPSALEWTGVMVGFGGVVLLAAGDLRATPAVGALLVVAPLGWALGSVLARRLPLPAGPMGAATQMIAGAFVTLAAAALRGEPMPTAVPARAALAFAYLVVFGSMVGFSAYNYLLRHTTTALATSYAYVNPVLAVALGALLGREKVGASLVASGALVVAGVALVAVGKSGQRTRDVRREMDDAEA